MLTRLKFTIRHVLAATVFAAVVCAIIVITAVPYTLAALAWIGTGLLIYLLPALLTIALASYFSRRKRYTAVTGIVLFVFAWLLLPWEHIRPDLTTLLAASFATGLISAIVAQIVVRLRFRSDDPPTIRRAPNPVKPLLYLYGGLCTVMSLLILRNNLSDRPLIVLGSVGYLVFGLGAVWLGHREYDTTARAFTITWGIAVCTLVTGAQLFHGTLLSHGLVILAFLLPVPIVAWRQPAIHNHD